MRHSFITRLMCVVFLVVLFSLQAVAGHSGDNTFRRPSYGMWEEVAMIAADSYATALVRHLQRLLSPLFHN
ncbi:hypothetical protein T484DRAFT_1784743 [Baffinella frigidus]|nr:hypothetical protein T484DRAFT_1784743 [Cryptophyta sp. CCMP2293]